MFMYLFVTLVIASVVYATSPTLVYECGTLDSAFSKYQLASDLVVQDTSYGFVCLDIIGDGIYLDGNGYEIYPASDNQLHATGVQYSGKGTVVANVRITNMRTGIHAKGTFGMVNNNTITRAVNGIDVSATNNNVINNIIGQFEGFESTAGISVYFPAIDPVDSYVNITNNVISDIHSDTFALGISVYYATSVYIAHNAISNLQGGISAQEISVISGHAETVGNSFTPPVQGSSEQAVTWLASIFAVVASLVFFYSASLSASTSFPAEKEKKEEKQKKNEVDEFDTDGADFVRPALSVYLGSSPTMRE